MQVHLVVAQHLTVGLWKGQAIGTCCMDILEGIMYRCPEDLASVPRMCVLRTGILLSSVSYMEQLGDRHGGQTHSSCLCAGYHGRDAPGEPAAPVGIEQVP